MKFAEIIRNAGLDISRFPKCASIQIRLYDGKDRVISEKTVEYMKPFFAENISCLKRFKKFLNQLENESITSMNVKVDVGTVVLFYQNPRATIFLRTPAMNPLDYMD